jgi:large subunit ribosomal protein L4e
MSNADLARIINSDEIQSIVKPAVLEPVSIPKKSNPLRNIAARISLNPYHKTVKEREEKKKTLTKAAKATAIKSRLASSKKLKSRRRAFYKAASKEGELAF